MLPGRLKAGLIIAAALLVAPAPWARAQAPVPESQHWSPFGPSEIRYDLELFKPPELSLYGNGPQPHTGLFFSYERLYWMFNRPPSDIIGSPTAPPPQSNSFVVETFPVINSLDLGTFRATNGWGNRWEIGYMNEDDVGWMVGVLDNVSQNQSQLYHFVEVQFDDPGTILDGYVNVENPLPPPDEITINIGKMVVDFIDFTIQHSTDQDGVEVLRMNRTRQFHNGGYLDWLYGARYLQLRDKLFITGKNYDTPGAVNIADPNSADLPFVPGTAGLEGVTGGFINPLANSFWGTDVDNDMIGPEIGLRWFRQTGRWTASAEARFLAAVNFQSLRFRSSLGDAASLYNAEFDEADPDDQVVIPREFEGLGTNAKRFDTTFSPVGEWRLNFAWAVTHVVNLKVGYTGMIIGNVGRSTNRMRYDVQELITLKDGGGTRNVFVANGVNFGIEINR